MIKPYLSDMINDHKTHSGNKAVGYETTLGEWKIQLTISIDFISSKDDSDETGNMRTDSDNIEIITGNVTNEIIEELLRSLLQKYQEG